MTNQNRGEFREGEAISMTNQGDRPGTDAVGVSGSVLWNRMG